jgi:hypothetical protein
MQNKNKRSSILPSAFIILRLLPLELVDRVLAQTLAVFFQLDFRRSAGDLDLGAIVQVTGFGALKPRHFAVFFCHDNLKKPRVLAPWAFI